MFHRWTRHLPDDVAMVPIRLPGREDRLNEQPYTDLSQLADDAAAAIADVQYQPYLLVGHSFGGYVALETLRRLLRIGYPPPAKLVVAACGAPRTGKARQPIADLPDDEFVAAVSERYDGIPAAVRERADLLAMVLPALRADMRMIEGYDNATIEPVDTDILALGGADDVGVAPSRLNEWRQLTTGRFAMRLFPGGHFFLHPQARRADAGTEVPATAPLSLIVSMLPMASEPLP